MGDEDEARFGLVMPFVVCRSRGGPHDDSSFVAGYRLGRLDAKLEARMTPDHNEYLRPDDVQQADLIAMRHGYTLVVTRSPDVDAAEWVHGNFRRISLAEPIPRE